MKKLVLSLSLVLAFSSATAAFAAIPQNIRIGTDPTYAPFESKNSQGELVGFDIDLAKELCKRINTQCTFVENPLDALIPSLKAKKIDAIMSSLSITEKRQQEIAFASESVALDTLGFEFLRDVAPGEAIYITEEGQLFTRQCADNPVSNPCLFEYVYFARPDSFIDKISVYSARVNMGTKLGEKIAREWEDLDIDVVIPIPETSCDIALEIARILGKPYRQGFVKNRYVGRTFIMPGQQLRRKSVRRKLNANRAEFRDKNVLLVDDSIVRGTTSEQIIEMAREAGAKKVYLASAAPEIRFPNVYGIDMPSATELIAHGREVDEIRQIIGADGLIFQDLNDLIEAVRAENPDIQQFECSVFNGVYVTKDVDQGYLDFLDTLRNDDAKAVQRQNEVENLEMHNEG